MIRSWIESRARARRHTHNIVAPNFRWFRWAAAEQATKPPTTAQHHGRCRNKQPFFLGFPKYTHTSRSVLLASFGELWRWRAPYVNRSHCDRTGGRDERRQQTPRVLVVAQSLDLLLIVPVFASKRRRGKLSFRRLVWLCRVETGRL
jgi:hypothetical protein